MKPATCRAKSCKRPRTVRRQWCVLHYMRILERAPRQYVALGDESFNLHLLPRIRG